LRVCGPNHDYHRSSYDETAARADTCEGGLVRVGLVLLLDVYPTERYSTPGILVSRRARIFHRTRLQLNAGGVGYCGNWIQERIVPSHGIGWRQSRWIVIRYVARELVC
jgi:hypothetical protein